MTDLEKHIGDQADADYCHVNEEDQFDKFRNAPNKSKLLDHMLSS